LPLCRARVVNAFRLAGWSALGWSNSFFAVRGIGRARGMLLLLEGAPWGDERN